MAFAKKRIRIICPEGGSKILFPSYKSAEVYLENVKKHARHPENFRPARIYYCNACGGYHTSTSTESRFDRMSPKARAEVMCIQYMRANSVKKLRTKAKAKAAPPKSEPKLVLELGKCISEVPEQEKLVASFKEPHVAIPGNIYRHFKGDYYQVLTIARHCDTNESLVVYQLIYHRKKKVLVRPYSEFVSEVDHQKYPNVRQKYRFQLQRVRGR